VITINGMFPGTLINTTTNDNIHVNVFNGLDEPLLMTWNGIQQRLNSWQDGVSRGQTVQSGPASFGGFGPLRVNNRNVILVPFNKPEAEFDLLIGDWYSYDYKVISYTLTLSSFNLLVILTSKSVKHASVQ
ncbi:hypothetical protein IFM89_026503, partial [Coptis chinensis]